MPGAEDLLPTSVLQQTIEKSLQEEQVRLEQLNTYAKDYDQLVDVLTTLPAETSRQIMVPFGKVAFFPGRLVHTNEILVHLGDQYYAERSSSQALDIVGRRKENVDGLVEASMAQIDRLRSRLAAGSRDASKAVRKVTKTDRGTIQELEGENGETLFEIREDFDPSIHGEEAGGGGSTEGGGSAVGSGPRAHPGTSGGDDAALWARLEALEMEEAEDERSHPTAALPASEHSNQGAAATPPSPSRWPPPRSPGDIVAYQQRQATLEHDTLPALPETSRVKEGAEGSKVQAPRGSRESPSKASAVQASTVGERSGPGAGPSNSAGGGAFTGQVTERPTGQVTERPSSGGVRGNTSPSALPAAPLQGVGGISERSVTSAASAPDQQPNRPVSRFKLARSGMK